MASIHHHQKPHTPGAPPGLQGFQGDAVALGVVLLNLGEQAKVFGGGAEDACVLLGFLHLFLELGRGAGVLIGAGLGGEIRVHGGVFVGFALDRQLQAAA